MRQVLSLSLPATDVKQIKQLTKKRGYSSVSSYIKYLCQEDSDLISEAELFKSARIARAEYRTGKAIKAQSLADLI
jgi:Arc/MetJ-type ribon-helix-helix transcriptional regulator